MQEILKHVGGAHRIDEEPLILAEHFELAKALKGTLIAPSTVLGKVGSDLSFLEGHAPW